MHSFVRFLQAEEPQRLAQCQRILAIPLQRITYSDPKYLSADDLGAVLAQPDLGTEGGRRDAVLLSVPTTPAQGSRS